jgi:hypothetical protein
MPKCAVCDAELKPEQKTCHLCGSNVEATASSRSTNDSLSPSCHLPPLPDPVFLIPSDLTTGDRECAACGKTFGTDYQEEFCPCGTELQAGSASGTTEIIGSTSLPAIPLYPASPAPQAINGITRPAAGTICLVVYSDAKPRQPLQYTPIMKDVLLIGREDAIRGDFPDLDLSSLLDESVAKKVSRRHAEVLRARGSRTYTLRPLPGNTGTQIGKELASPGQEYPLTDGTAIVLGGVVWMKFETIK